MLYRFAVETGLRASELRSLRRASLDFDAKTPTVTVAAAYSKHRCDDILPLRPTTAQLVQEHLKHKAPAANASAMPRSERVAEMFRSDLDAARTKWLEEVKEPKQRSEREKSSFLSYRDHSNRVADFHALRHTFITNLARAGVHPKTAQSDELEGPCNSLPSDWGHPCGHLDHREGVIQVAQSVQIKGNRGAHPPPWP